MTEVCSDCPKPLARNPRRKGTRCVACAARHRQSNLSDAQRRAIADRCRAVWNRPGYRQHMAWAGSEGQRRRLQDPEECARVQANCRRAQAMRGPPSAETRAKISRAKTEQFLGWCPLEYRGEYRALVSSKKLPAAEARALIEAQITADLKSYVATGILPVATRTPGGNG